MSQKFRIIGGKELGGEIVIQGSKNAALPLIAATLLTEDQVTLENIPDIDDVGAMVAIAEKLGAETEWARDQKTLVVRAKNLATNAVDETLSRKLRGSLLFSGAVLGRLRSVILPYPGGDAIGARPLTTHLRALEALGAKTEEDKNLLHIDGRALSGGEIALEEQSVTATENTILAAVLAPGKTTITFAAVEPHVQELVLLLSKMGADIKWSNFSRLEINGVSRLRGAAHRVNPDELEISSLATLAAATRSTLILKSIKPEYLDAVFLYLKKMGVCFELRDDSLKILKPSHSYKSFRIQSGLYPKLISDHIPPLAVLATQAEGTSLIHDWLYEGRLRYIPELQKMGADCTILDQHRALITGPVNLQGCPIDTFDIRSGMTLIIAALTAEGQSTIDHIEHMDRGYERIEERLRGIGAEIKRIEQE